MLTQEDKLYLSQKGISEEKLNAQLECFKTGFPWLKLASAASAESGIRTSPAMIAEKNVNFFISYICSIIQSLIAAQKFANIKPSARYLLVQNYPYLVQNAKMAIFAVQNYQK